MRKLIFFLTFFTLAFYVNAQVVYEYDLGQLALKKYKSNPEFSISDHTFTALRTLTGVKVRFVGSGTRPLVFKGFKGEYKIEMDGVYIKTNTTGKTLKFIDCVGVDLDGSNNTKIIGSGNTSGQLIDFDGRWANVKIHGFYLDQMRNTAPVETKDGGAMIQLHGIEDPTFNHGDIKIWDIDGRNSNDEFIYVLLYYSNNASRAKRLEIWHTNIHNSGRDFWQATNIDSVFVHDNTGDNGGLESNGDHISGFTGNNGNKFVRLENNRVTNTPQFFYSGSATGKLETSNNVYIQGTSTYINNQAIYTKSETLLQLDSIIAPKVKIAAIAQDKAVVTYQGLTVVSPNLFRYTTPVPVELPVVIDKPVQAIEHSETIGGKTTKVLIYNNQKFPLQ